MQLRLFTFYSKNRESNNHSINVIQSIEKTKTEEIKFEDLDLSKE